jgi:hypothetical protein
MRDSILGPDRSGDLPDEDLPQRPLRSTQGRGPGRPRKALMDAPDGDAEDDELKLPPPLPPGPPKPPPTPEKLEAIRNMMRKMEEFEDRENAKIRVSPDSPLYDLTTPLADMDSPDHAKAEREFEKWQKEQKKVAKKDDVASMVGRELLQGYKAAAKELAISQLDPGVSPLSSVANTISARTVGDLAAQFPTVNMRIKRRNPTTMRWEIIPGPRGIDPKALTETGALEDLILNWSGGGEYDIELAAPGTKGFVPITFTIDAPSIPTPAFRNGGSSSFAPGGPQDSALAKYLSQQQTPTAQQQQQQHEQGGLLKLVEQMLAMQLAQTMNPRQDPYQGSSREVEELKRQTAELQQQLRASEDRSRADRERAEMMQRMEEIGRRADAAAQAKPDPLLTLLTALAPLAPAFLAKGDSSALATSTMMQAVLNQQQQSSTTTLELFKAMNAKPEVEDRFASLVGTMGNMSANTMAMVTQVMQSGLLEKNGDSPITQIISQVIGEAADVAKTLFASGAFGGGNSAQAEPAIEAQTTALPSLPPASHTFINPPSANAIGALPAHETVFENEVEDEIEDEGEVEGEIENEDTIADTAPSADNTYDLMRDTAFREILMRIRNNGDLRDIAVRLYKHGNVVDPDKGHPVAKAWFTDPQNAGRGIMGQLGVEPTRIDEIVIAIEALTQYLASGKELGEYLPTRRNRESRRIPATSATSTQLGEHFDAATIQRIATVPPAPVEATQQPPTVEAAPVSEITEA